MTLQVSRFELVIKLAVPVNELQKHLPAPVDKLGEQLAEQAHKVVVENLLGYYPALNYFADQPGFPTYLIDAVNEVCALAVEVVTSRISEVLIPIFSSVQVNNIQCASFSLPSIRPGNNDAVLELAHHYTPNVIKFELIVSLLQQHSAREGLHKYVDNTVFRWLSEIFDKVEISSTRLL